MPDRDQAESDQLVLDVVPATNELRALVDILDRLSIQAYTLHVTDGRFYADRSPDAVAGSRRQVSIRLTVIGRTFFEGLCAALHAKPTERVVHPGQRSWWAESDTATRRLLIEGVSFQHHDDWQPRPAKEKANA